MILSVVLLSLITTLCAQVESLLDQYKIGDDLRHLYWMAGFQDPELFPDDPLLYEDRYYAIHLGETRVLIEKQSPGYSLLFYLVSFLVDPILFSKVLPFFLMPIYVTYLFGVGKRLRSNICGLSLSLLGIVLGLVAPGAIQTGYHRAFAFPLMAVFLYYATIESGVGVAISLVLQGLTYPPALAVCSLAYVFSWVHLGRGKLKVEITRKKIVPLFAAVLVVTLVLSPVLLNYVSVVRWTAGTPARRDVDKGHTGLLDNPAYGVNGRDAVFNPNRIFGVPLYLVVGFAGLIPNYGVAASLTPLLLVCGLSFVIIGRRSFRVGPHVWSLVGAGVLLFVVAWVAGLALAAFVLNMPGKYVKASIPFWVMIYLAYNVEDFVGNLFRPRWSWFALGVFLSAMGVLMLLMGQCFSPGVMVDRVSGDHQIAESSLDSLSRLRMGIVVVGVTSIILGVASWALGVCRRFDLQSTGVYSQVVSVLLGFLLACLLIPALKPPRMEIPQAQRGLLEYVATLPKDALIAGAPEVLDNIPLYAKRQVAFSPERLSDDKQLIVDSFDAYYAESGERVLDFCRRYGVDYWVVDLAQFETSFLEEQRFFYDPFNDEIADRISERRGFVFPQIAREFRLFEAGDLVLVGCDDATFDGTLSTGEVAEYAVERTHSQACAGHTHLDVLRLRALLEGSM